jgi:pyrroline-5-carboxylate reductase
MALRIGFIGTGHITKAFVIGLCTSPVPPERVLLSPRNAVTAAGLAERHRGVAVAADNQAVIDGSDWVVLAVRPQVAREVLTPLVFRPAQKVVSFIAPIADEWIDNAVRPARLLARVAPLPPVERRLGPIAFFPFDAEVEALIARVGRPVAVADKRGVLVLWALTALMATHYAVIEKAAAWAAENGVPADSAATYATSMYEALSIIAATPGAAPLDELVRSAQTRGGLNEQVLRELTEARWLERMDASLDGIVKRLEGRA